MPAFGASLPPGTSATATIASAAAIVAIARLWRSMQEERLEAAYFVGDQLCAAAASCAQDDPGGVGGREKVHRVRKPVR
jgi:hypothetical protein